MLFGEKLKKLRTDANMSQDELATKLGITRRSIVYYETKSRYPKSRDVIAGIARIFNVSSDYLIDDKDEFVMQADLKYGSGGVHDAQKLVNEIGGLFAGGRLKDEDKDKVFKAISDLYWESKEMNKKYSAAKNKKEEM